MSVDASFLPELMVVLDRKHKSREDMTPREFVREISFGPAAVDVEWLVKTAYEILWGGKRMDPVLREQIAEAMNRVRSLCGVASSPQA